MSTEPAGNGRADEQPRTLLALAPPPPAETGLRATFGRSEPRLAELARQI